MKTKTSEVKEHSEFGGSQAKKIKNCPASVLRSRGIPQGASSPASMGGTAAHACLEFMVNNREALMKKSTRLKILKAAKRKFTMCPLEDGSGKEIKILWTQAMIDDALDALTYIMKALAPDHTVYVETKLDSSKFTTTGQFSSLDVGIANWSARELIVIDYKYGKHPVPAKKNDQLIYYALALLLKLKAWKKIDRVRLVIIQPNGGGIREWWCDVDYLIKWGRKFRKITKLALTKKAPAKYGEWCFFCPAKKTCPTFKNEMAKKDFA